MNLIKKIIGKNDSLEKTLKSRELEKFSVVKMEQVHGNSFAEIVENKNQTIPGVDTTITTKKNILLSVKTADCLPILIHWENRGSIPHGVAAIHSGRAGTEKKILTKVLNHLKNKYRAGAGHGKITLWLGPAICKKCYQIDKETDLHYDLYQKNIDQIWQVFPKDKFGKKIKIIRSKHCTLHDNELFYSHRKTGRGVPMNYSLIGMI